MKIIITCPPANFLTGLTEFVIIPARIVVFDKKIGIEDSRIFICHMQRYNVKYPVNLRGTSIPV